jgi:hypothetical protein
VRYLSSERKGLDSHVPCSADPRIRPRRSREIDFFRVGRVVFGDRTHLSERLEDEHLDRVGRGGIFCQLT